MLKIQKNLKNLKKTKKYLKILVILILILFISHNTFAVLNTNDKNALRALYDASSNINDWATNWDFNNSDPCIDNWVGISCSWDDIYIIQITSYI